MEYRELGHNMTPLLHHGNTRTFLGAIDHEEAVDPLQFTLEVACSKGLKMQDARKNKDESKNFVSAFKFNTL